MLGRGAPRLVAARIANGKDPDALHRLADDRGSDVVGGRHHIDNVHHVLMSAPRAIGFAMQRLVGDAAYSPQHSTVSKPLLR